MAASNGNGWCNPEGLRRLQERFVGGEDSFDAFRVAFLAQWLQWTGSTGSAASATRKTVRETTYQ
jgi:hypothetical protein